MDDCGCSYLYLFFMDFIFFALRLFFFNRFFGKIDNLSRIISNKKVSKLLKLLQILFNQLNTRFLLYFVFQLFNCPINDWKFLEFYIKLTVLFLASNISRSVSVLISPMKPVLVFKMNLMIILRKNLILP